MKKSVKRQNARKSAKKNAKKRVSTRKIKQRGGMDILVLFICTCITIIAVLYYKHVPTMELQSYEEIIRNFPNKTPFQNCLISKDGTVDDPFTFCQSSTLIGKDDSSILTGFGKCVRDTSKKIDYNVDTGIYKLKGDDSIGYAGRDCYKKGINKYIQDERQKHAETCAISLATLPQLDKKCFPNVIKLYNEPEVTINKDIKYIKDTKDTNEITIYSAHIPGHKHQIDVIGSPELGFFSTEFVKITELGMTDKDITKIFKNAQNVVKGQLPQYAQNVFFIDNGEYTIVRYADSNNPNAPVLEFIRMDSNTVAELRNKHLAQLPE